MNPAREADPRDLFRLAEAIADGEAVDWDVEESTHPGLEETLRSLRTLEEVGQAHRPAETPTPRTWGSLQIRELIGAGSFAEVYRAYDPALESEVALKLLRADPRARDLLAEARKLARIGDHENILRVYGADEHEGRVGIWTELLPGQTLEERLLIEGPLGAGEAAQIGMSICRALAALHKRGLVHRDLKTRNVMRVRGGRIVVTDFGSAVDVDAGPEGGHEGITPMTMAPEQLRNERVGPAADIWALGVLLYRLVTHRYPMEARTLPELIERHAHRELTPLCDARPDLPAEFVRVVERALAFEPRQRYASAGQFYQALAGAIGVRVTGKDPVFIDPWWKRYQVPITAAAVMVLAAGWAGTFQLMTGRFPWDSRKRDAAAAHVSAGSPLVTPATSSLIATARLYRESQDRVDRLLPGSRIAPGDNLFLEVVGSDAMYVYVLDRDEQGQAYVLYPGPAFDGGKGALAPGVTHRLPGTRGGRLVDWKVTSSGGKETVVVIASRTPQPDLERDIAGIPQVSPEQPIIYGRVSDQTTEVLRIRGIGGLVQRHDPGGPSADRLNGAIRKLYTDSVAGSDLWTWQIELANP